MLPGRSPPASEVNSCIPPKKSLAVAFFDKSRILEVASVEYDLWRMSVNIIGIAA
jgi:hypothetical protein